MVCFTSKPLRKPSRSLLYVEKTKIRLNSSDVRRRYAWRRQILLYLYMWSFFTPSAAASSQILSGRAVAVAPGSNFKFNVQYPEVQAGNAKVNGFLFFWSFLRPPLRPTYHMGRSLKHWRILLALFASRQHSRHLLSSQLTSNLLTVSRRALGLKFFNFLVLGGQKHVCSQL